MLKKKVIIILIAILVLGGAGGAFLYFNPFKQSEAKLEEKAKKNNIKKNEDEEVEEYIIDSKSDNSVEEKNEEKETTLKSNPNSEVSTIVNEQKNEVNTTSVVNTITPEEEYYNKMMTAISKVENDLNNESFKEAADLVSGYTNEAQKEELLKRLDVVSNEINTKLLVEELNQKVISAQNITDIENARAYFKEQDIENKLNNLPNENLKTNLNSSLIETLKILNDTNKPVITFNTRNITDNSFITLNRNNYDKQIQITDENEVKVEVKNTINNEITPLITNDNNIKYLSLKNTSSGTYKVTLTDKSFNQVNFTIDKDTISPSATVSYSNTELTNEKVTVTLTSSESISLPSGWESKGNHTYTKEYEKNTLETVNFYDYAGNSGNVQIEIINIDKEVDVEKLDIYVKRNNEKLEANDGVIEAKKGDTIYFDLYLNEELQEESIPKLKIGKEEKEFTYIKQEDDENQKSYYQAKVEITEDMISENELQFTISNLIDTLENELIINNENITKFNPDYKPIKIESSSSIIKSSNLVKLNNLSELY